MYPFRTVLSSPFVNAFIAFADRLLCGHWGVAARSKAPSPGAHSSQRTRKEHRSPQHVTMSSDEHKKGTKKCYGVGERGQYSFTAQTDETGKSSQRGLK